MESTEDEPPKADSAPAMAPKKRRRWPIVAFVLVLMSLVSWWNLPRGDARFVGKWKLQDDPAVGGGMSWELRSNGIAVLRPGGPKGGNPPRTKSPIFARWKFDGVYLINGNPGHPPANSYLNSFARFLRRYFAVDVMTDRGDTYIVGSVGANEIYIALPFGDSFDGFKLVRVPE